MRWSRHLAAGLILATFALASTCAVGEDLPLVYKKKYAMGTVFEIAAYDPSKARASEAIDQAFAEIVRLDQVMSNYQPDSDLSRLNRSAHNRAQVVPRDLYQVIQASLQYSRLSAGEFDITVGPLVDLWKAVMRGDRVFVPADEERLRRCVGYQKLELLPPNRIKFDSVCLEIDLGAIGKGYAVDRAAAVLRWRGVGRALINAGGSTIYGMGAPPGQSAWLVRLRDPSAHFDPQVGLHDSSVSTSEQTGPSLLGGTPAGHIVDPATGAPAETSYAVSVVADTATSSDALSTTLLLLGPEKGKAVVTRLSHVAAIWVAPDGQWTRASSGPEITVHSVDEAGR